jgi:hypothetical protein
MMIAHKGTHRAGKIDDKVLLEGKDYVFEAPLQIDWVILTERISDQG